MSEFGKGLTYCLGLFLAHAERKKYLDDYGVWFNGSADHLYEIDPSTLPSRLKGRVNKFQNKCLEWRLSFATQKPTKDDFEWAIQEAKDLLRLIDKNFGVKTKKGEWE